MKMTKKLSGESGEIDPAIMYRLLKEQDIELAGILARKNAAEDNRDQAKRYYDLLKQMEEARRIIQSELPKVKAATRQIDRYESILANPPEEMRPVKVIDNKVIIHPVQQPDTQPARGK
jgi:hypothetical protein